MSEKQLTTDTAIKYLESIIHEDFAPYTQKCLLKVIEVAREAEPVVHGWWEIITDDYGNEMLRCTVCKSEYYDGDNDTVDTLHNYCPNCGAKMKGANDE